MAREANKAKLEEALAECRARREAVKLAPEGGEQSMREHWDGSFIMEFDGVVEFDSEAERTGTPSLVGQRLPPKKERKQKG